MGTINYLTSDVITLVHDSSMYDRDFIRDECILNDSVEERANALKEVDTLKSVLLYVHEIGFDACSLSWSPKYYNHDETIQKIDDAINELKSRINNTTITA